MKATAYVPMNLDHSTSARRQYECERKRKYRAEQRTQREKLQNEVGRLHDELVGKLKNAPKHQQVIAQRELARIQEQELVKSKTKNRQLKQHVHRYHQLLQLLHQWVNQSVQPALRDRNASLNSTLLSHPIARQYGLHWLTDRVFHSAKIGHSFDGSIEDVARLHVCMDDDNMEIVGMECHFQTTLMWNYKMVADCLSTAYVKVRADTSQVSNIFGDENFVYNRVYDKLLGTSMCTIHRRYDVDDRVFLVCVFLQEDECFPLKSNELRPHGLGWTVLEKVTDTITLSRSYVLQYAPITTDGVISFERNAAMFGAEPNSSHEVMLARIENNAYRNFVARRQYMQRDLEHRLEAMTLSSVKDEWPCDV